MEDPRVSVVIPAYNREKHVGRAIDSVLNQTYHISQIIVVDDGSTDCTRETIRRYGRRITYIYQKNKGPAAARNSGIRAAKGDYIAFLDTDDLWDRNKIYYQIKLAKAQRRAGLIDCFAEIVTEGGMIIRKMHCIKKGESFQKLLYANVINTTSSALVKRSVFADVGLFNDSLRSVEDRELWLRIADRYPVLTVSRYLVKYLVHDKNVSRDYLSMRKGTEAFLDIVLSRYRRRIGGRKNRIISYNLAYYIPYYIKDYDLKGARKLFLQCMSLYPGIVFTRKSLLFFLLSNSNPGFIRTIYDMRRRIWA